MVKFLIDRCGLKEDLLTAAGNAEFRPIAPNDGEYNRQKNRRIDIIILK
jgi:chemotaxis protein MotB